eukprot:Skav216951  [mRNA]  locus=scaffold4155:10984:12882:- [translate_table: standard]
MLFVIIDGTGLTLVEFRAGGIVAIDKIESGEAVIDEPLSYGLFAGHLTSDQAQAMCKQLGSRMSGSNHDSRAGLAEGWGRVEARAIEMLAQNKVKFNQGVGVPKLVIFKKRNGDLCPKVLHSGDVMTMDIIRDIPANPLTVEQASKLTNAELLEFIEAYGGMTSGLKSKSKTVLAEHAVNAFNSYLPREEAVEKTDADEGDDELFNVEDHTLMFASTPFGFTALALPRVFTMNLMQPIFAGQFLQYDISHSAHRRLGALPMFLERMDENQLRQVYRQMDVELPDDFDREHCVQACLDTFCKLRDADSHEEFMQWLSKNNAIILSKDDMPSSSESEIDSNAGSASCDDVEDVIYSLDAFTLDDDVEIGKCDADRVKVVLKTMTGSHQIILYLDPNETVSHVKNEISWLTGLGDGYKLVGSCSKKVWEDEMSIDTLSMDNYMAYISLRLRGGGLIKRHVKREDALKALLKKSVASIKKDINTEGITTPDEVKAMIEKLRPVIDEAQVLKARGIKVIQTSLRTLSDDNLTSLVGIMKHSATGRRESSVEKIQKAFGVIFPRCFVVNDAISSLMEFQAEMSEVFLEFYIQEYAVVSGDEAKFSNEAFVKDLTDEQKRRANAGGYTAIEQSSNCDLM